MLIQQIPSRVVKFEGTSMPTFPADVQLRARLGPAELFGEADLSGRLCLHPPGSEVQLTADLNRGGVRSEPGARLDAPDIHAPFFDTQIALQGSDATVSFTCSSPEAFETAVRATGTHLAAMLSNALAEPVEIVDLSGEVDGQRFRVEFKGSSYRTIRVPLSAVQIREELIGFQKLPGSGPEGVRGAPLPHAG